MKLDSKLFDAVRIRPRRRAEPEDSGPQCAWEGCDQPGLYRAPKGHRAIGQYHHFCLEHVRHYNTAFNFFAGMDADEIEAHVNRTGQPESSFGVGGEAGRARQARPRAPRSGANRFSDPLNIFARYARAQARNPQAERKRPVHEPDRRALETLGLDGAAKADDIKKAYKSLVKIHHPDANGGDRSSEDRLRAIISAYSHLKAAGFVGR